MRYYLTRVSIVFPYAGVRLGRVLPVDPDSNVPAEVYEGDPPPEVEEDGNTRHVYFWSTQDWRWDERPHLDRLRSAIELQGHSVESIRVEVVRTRGEPTQQQQRLDELAIRRRAAIAGYYGYGEHD